MTRMNHADATHELSPDSRQANRIAQYTGVIPDLIILVWAEHY